jgi:hypothetical protein
MITPQPRSNQPIVGSMMTATREFFDFLRDLVDTQPPIGSIIMSLSLTPPKGYIALGESFTQERYPRLYALTGGITPSTLNGLYFAHVPEGFEGVLFGTNEVSISHEHQTQAVSSGAGATALKAGDINPLEIDNRPRTYGVRCYIRAE